MSMFTRNDKVADANPDEMARPREAPVSTAPVAPAAKPAQAIVQPLSNTAASRVPSVSVISKALKITGQLESTDDIRIDGEVDGDVRADSVTVGSGAKVKGTVYGTTVELSGTIDGKIEAEKVVLTSTAHMSGDVIHQDIKIESGAFIDGHCRPEFGKYEDKTAHSASKPTATFSGLATQTKSGDATTKT
jgi:cytoskeletal protein CcmA (bactofilin family)